MSAQLYNATRLLHGELGNRPFPHSLQPLNHQTRTPPHTHATASRSTCPTSHHSLTTDKRACPPDKATRSSPPHQHHKEEACHQHPEAPPQEPRHISSRSSHPRPLSVCAPGAHLLQPSSEAYDAEDRCFCAPVARRLMLPHPATSDPSGIVLTCPTKAQRVRSVGTSADAQQHHRFPCRYGGGVDRRHAAVTRCLADVTHSQKVHRAVRGSPPSCGERPGRTRTHGSRL